MSSSDKASIRIGKCEEYDLSVLGPKTDSVVSGAINLICPKLNEILTRGETQHDCYRGEIVLARQLQIHQPGIQPKNLWRAGPNIAVAFAKHPEYIPQRWLSIARENRILYKGVRFLSAQREFVLSMWWVNGGWNSDKRQEIISRWEFGLVPIERITPGDYELFVSTSRK